MDTLGPANFTVIERLYCHGPIGPQSLSFLERCSLFGMSLKKFTVGGSFSIELLICNLNQYFFFVYICREPSADQGSPLCWVVSQCSHCYTHRQSQEKVRVKQCMAYMTKKQVLPVHPIMHLR